MHLTPTVLPDGRTALYTVTLQDKAGSHSRIDGQSLESGDRRTILDDAWLVGYVAGTGLLFVRGSHVMAARFDPERLVVTSDPVRVLDDPYDMAVTNDGMVAYTPADSTMPERTLVWVDHQGREQSINAPSRAYEEPTLSPDGRRIATAIFDGARQQVWIYDLVRSALMPFTSEGSNVAPFWTADGARVVFSSPRGGKYALFSRPSDRSGPAELINPDCGCSGASFDHDAHLLYCGQSVVGSTTAADIWIVSDAGRGVARPFMEVPFIQAGPRVSPDDHWLAYVSDESGRWEVYVTSLPDAHGKWQVSTDGGGEPVWSRDGRTLFFRGSGKVMSVAIDSSAYPQLTERPPVAVLADTYVPGHPVHANYDVSADGSHFLMVKGERPDRVSEIRILQGWKTKVASMLGSR